MFHIRVFLIIFFLSTVTQASKPDLKLFLDRFHNETATVMAELPQKTSSRDTAIYFSEKQIREKSYIDSKNSVREFILSKRPGGQRILSEYLAEDNAYTFFDNPSSVVDRLDVMENRKLLSARIPTKPWSDTYWPLYQGQTGARYGHQNFPASRDWKVNFDFIVANPPISTDPSRFNTYSPAEKYDLLVGNSRFELTQSAWSEGKIYFDKYGTVETWMGICHGWAVAAFMLPKPIKSVEIQSLNGPIKFYPADIRGMGTLLWASGRSNTRFLGGRCNSKAPETDPTTGRVTDPTCFDTNPATWHIAVVNRVGIDKDSFVLDANFDYEVWNQPVYAYKYRYFNPQTGAPVESLAEAKVLLSNYTNDKFKGYRSAKAVNVVGVSMDLTYVVENRPSQLDDESQTEPYFTTVRYIYDLEVDSDGTLIGGEWYQNAHPDFLWRPLTNSRAVSVGDRMISGTWDGVSLIPDTWRYGAKVSASYGQPLAAVVEILYEKSKK